MKIRKYSYILCMFAAMVGIMTACASDEQEEMFPGEGEPVTVKLSIDTRAAGADDFESQVKTLRVYAFHNGSLVGYYYGGEDVQPHTFKWKLPQGEVWFYAVANEQAAGKLLSENKGDIFVLPGETVGGTSGRRLGSCAGQTGVFDFQPAAGSGIYVGRNGNRQG